jgi:hypothetical protein
MTNIDTETMLRAAMRVFRRENQKCDYIAAAFQSYVTQSIVTH